MCGILGVILGPEKEVVGDELQKITSRLLLISESRGKEASGVAVVGADAIQVLKSPLPASELIRRQEYSHAFGVEQSLARVAIAHARLVTNGSMEKNINNQPVIRDGLVGVHNGIIVNDAAVWAAHRELSRDAEVDSEVALALLRKHLQDGKNIIAATKSLYVEIKGTATLALLFKENDNLLLCTNNGSLYCAQNENGLIFASERTFVERFLKTTEGKFLLGAKVKQVEAGRGMLVDSKTLAITEFGIFDNESILETPSRMSNKTIEEIAWREQVSRASIQGKFDEGRLRDEYIRAKEAIAKLKRCTRCILPETMPFILFDDTGVCNYCINYSPMKFLGEKALAGLADKMRRTDGRPEIIVGFSGGRDSSYTLHYVKEVLGLKPVAYTYDWGMITDLGRRNQARLCGALGVEHILVSADIRSKRRNIRRNIEAWLKRPELGTVPIFMAGDKQYFYHMNKLKTELGVENILYSENPLEKTSFKTGFCGLPPIFKQSKDFAYNLGLIGKVQLLKYYGFSYLANPAYINSSLADTIGAFASSFFIPHEYTYFFDYIQWDEKKIEDTLIEKYDWEMASDAKTTWRIGDGTAPFYNLIYYIVAGLTENDTFRSNQVREGMLTRNEALRLSERDNVFRADSLKWYFDTIGIDGDHTLGVIYGMPRRYPFDR